MENLKEVEVYMRPPGASGDSCSYFRVKPDDRQLHRPGLCVVNLGAIYDNCPNLEKFLGHDLSALPLTTKNGSKLTFSAWKSELKKVFFEEYSRSGGTKDINSWTKSRWCFKSPLAEVEKEKERNLKKARQEMWPYYIVIYDWIEKYSQLKQNNLLWFRSSIKGITSMY